MINKNTNKPKILYIADSGGELKNISVNSASINNAFNLGDLVYHVTNEELTGVVTDIKYTFKDKCLEYLVSWGPGEYTWINEFEINLKEDE